MKKKLIITALIIVGLGIIGGSIGLYLYFKPVKDFASSKADFTMTANELFSLMVNANKENKTPDFISKDKTVQIKGKIKEISKNDDGSFTLSIDPGSTDGSVSCTLVKGDSWRVPFFNIGSEVTLKGQVTGIQDLIEVEVIMIGCGIVV